MLALLVCAASLLVSAGGPDDETIKEEKTVDLVGFSKDESVAAWRISIERYAQRGSLRYVDRYTVIRVVLSESNEVVGHYREGQIQRLSAVGKPLWASAQELARANPLWERAQSNGWNSREYAKQRLDAQGHLNIHAQSGARVTAWSSGALRVAQYGPSLTYELEVHASTESLGRFSYQGLPGQTVTSIVTAEGSLSGQYVAVRCEFEIGRANPNQPRRVTYGRIGRAGARYLTGTTAVPGHEKREPDYVMVRTMWGWKEMTPEQERIWREHRDLQVSYAQQLMQYAQEEGY